MAQRFIPGPTAKFVPLVAEGGVYRQEPYTQVGIEPVNFGPKSRTNTIPGKAAEAAAQGRKVPNNLGRQFDQMRSNTDALLRHAQSQGKLDEWSRFYEHAHDFAADLTRQVPGLTHLQASGVVASMSGGGGEWSKNRQNAIIVATAHVRGLPVTTKDLANVEGKRLDNAQRILNGADPREVLGNLKEAHFMENIHTPHGSEVTVDTHMHHGMTGWKRNWGGAGGGAPGLQDPRVYHFMAGAIRESGEQFNLNPAAAQSAAWYAQKNLMGGRSGSPPPHHPRFEEYYPKARPGKRYRQGD